MRQQKRKKYGAIPIVTRTALALAVAAVSLGVQAGKITSLQTDTAPAGFGGWNLNNVEVIVNGTQGEPGVSNNLSWFDESDGAYSFAIDSDYTYEGLVYDDDDDLMGKVLAKPWPVGEPSGIKVVNDDPAVQNGKPANCIMATSYLDGHFLDSADPQQVTCSGPFQSHKRYKLAMLPSTVDGDGSESVDLVFNVEAEEGLAPRDYQVFQKINNWTDRRLAGFTIQLGFGVGEDFVSIDGAESEAGEGADIHSNLYLTVPAEIWSENQLAIFSEGLFGPFDDKTETIGFFDPDNRAGFKILEYTPDGPTVQTDILHSDGPLGSAYAQIPPNSGVVGQFGPWLPNNMLPYGVFFDDDGDPATDAELLAWYGMDPSLNDGAGALGWMGGSQPGSDPFRSIPDTEIYGYGENLLYTQGLIDDLVNVGLNYIVTLGDVSTFPGATFTIRITPQLDTSGAPDPEFVGNEPAPVLLFRSHDGAISLDPGPYFSAGSLLTARVGDADLNGDPLVVDTVDVLIATTAEGPDAPPPQTLALIEQGANRGVFVATLPEAFSNIDAGTVTLTYVDADDGNGTVPDVPNPVTKQASTTLDTTDTDADGILDIADNCIEAANGTLIPDAGGNSQLDTDGDGYGNMCDADLSNDGVVNLSDFSLFRAAFGQSPADEDADFNGDAAVNLSDYSIFRSQFGAVPGPSCCGETD